MLTARALVKTYGPTPNLVLSDSSSLFRLVVMKSILLCEVTSILLTLDI